MGIKRRLMGLVILSFGAGVLCSILFPCIGFFIGVLLVIVGAMQLFC